MALIVGIVSAVIILALIILFFLANGSRTRTQTISEKAVQPQEEKHEHRAAGID